VNIEEFVPEISPGIRNLKPFVRRSVKGGGCDLEGCNCSPSHWVSFSDGRRGFKIVFEDELELELFLRGVSYVRG
jgi:hypothetical protein